MRVARYYSREDIRLEQQEELSRFAMQTFAASNAVTNQLLAELVAALDKTRMAEYEGITSVLRQMEANRLAEDGLLRKEFATFASYTDEELSRTRAEVAELLSHTRPRDVDVQPLENR